MPRGYERINTRTSQPNALINFIRPLQGPNEEHSRDFLSRVAAQCYPIMKSHHTAVMVLAEHEWNPEFAGRNFNAGELIELVLRGKSGQWLPFKHVQLVMMHELAHCKQMNHGSDFWKIRNQYCDGIKGLWDKGYTGEGLWGRGRAIDGRFVEGQTIVEGDMPEHVCSGTYRRQGRGRKRKRGGEKQDKSNISYAEQQQKRILKKFGTGGMKLGDDKDARVKLEEGKKQKGKPRVAGSARGRDLRAAAALARFDQVKKEEKVNEEETDSGTESEYDWPLTDDDTSAVDRTGKKITDAEGHGMVRVCGAENEDDEDVKRETKELGMINIPPSFSLTKRTTKKPASKPTYNSSTTESDSDVEKPGPRYILPAPSKQIPLNSSEAAISQSSSQPLKLISGIPHNPPPTKNLLSNALPQRTPSICPTCSFENTPNEIICVVCSNVLFSNTIRNIWRCKSDVCTGSAFINHGDSRRCAVCGGSRA